jgi:hypothetical protein
LRDAEAESMMIVLRHVFLVRLAKRKMAPNAGWFEQFTRCCSIKDDSVVLDESKFLSRVLNVAAGTLAASAVETELKRLASLQACQSYHAAHGHDIVRLISWIAHKKGVSKEIANPAPLERALLSLIEIEDIQKEPLFTNIAGWAASAEL